ncbi:phosphatidylinositol-binding clathrin assembly protein isoform X4 [Paramisgurnus dabryanus]|uniref:phosphatidylinositol-binding clathrin assembly protein isoform X4 n=1 Tax=Paramisgurnus dabryanus TaxID=90735 RepID=UPI003CCFB7F9
MSGQSITDRIAAAQHSMTGSAISKAVCKASTHEVSGPKKKHLDYLIHCTNEMNVNVPQLADTLFERSANNSWVVVFKALITTHHLMMYGNERFIQYLASRNTLFNLNNFLDKGALQGYDMSTFIRRYSRYLNEKALSYRLVAVDFTKMKRGIDGVMRTMNTEKLIKTLPIIQNQLDALLDFQANPNELTNGVINAAFMLLFKDSIRLFAAYNEGVINLLEKYFDMKKNQCKDALDIYKKFLYRMTKLSEFLKVAEQVGIDQGDIPDLTQAPSSLLEALEQHLASLEGKKTKELSADNRANTLSNAVSSLSNTGMSFSRMDEKEKQQALEEEQARLQALKDQRLKEIGMHTPSASPSTQSMGSANNHTAGMDLFANNTSPMSTNSMPNLNSDLFDLQPAFVPAVQSTPITTNSSAWGGDLLKPTMTVHSQAPVMPHHTGGKLLASDLDSSLANLVGNLQFGGIPGKKSDMQWTQPGEKKLTGGTNWQSKTMSSTTAWSPAPMPPAAMPVPHMAPAPMAFPMTTPQVPVYGIVPPQLGQMGGVPVMTQQPMLYNQTVLRPTNPFTPIPGAQMQFM